MNDFIVHSNKFDIFALLLELIDRLLQTWNYQFDPIQSQTVDCLLVIAISLCHPTIQIVVVLVPVPFKGNTTASSLHVMFSLILPNECRISKFLLYFIYFYWLCRTCWALVIFTGASLKQKFYLITLTKKSRFRLCYIIKWAGSVIPYTNWTCAY